MQFLFPMLLSRALVWALVLALPVQGAAAPMLHLCRPGHHDLQRGLPIEQADQDFGRGGELLQAHSHSVDGPTNASSPRDHDASALEPRKLAHSGAGMCSECADCCCGVAIPSVTLPAITAEASVDPAASPQRPVFRYITGGPDRPPQSLLA